MHNAKLSAALAWAARGFRVFPLTANGTKPVWAGWTETATTDPATIRAWWEGTDYNIGTLTNGMFVPDLDMKNGKDGVAAWIALHGGFDTLTVRTKSGGYHLYYSGADVANSVGEVGDGIDVRSHNGYVVAPGSIVDGIPYEVVIDQAMAPAPPAIVAMCKPPGARAEHADIPLGDLDRPADIEAAKAIISATKPEAEGGRDAALFKLLCRVRDCGVSEDVARNLDELARWAAACSPPLGPGEVQKVLTNAYQYGQNRIGVRSVEAMFGKVNIPPLPPEPSPQEVQAAQAARSGLRLLTVDDCADAPPRDYVIKGMLAPGQVACIFGQPGEGKSVLAPHLAYAVAQGRRVFGQRTTQGAVLYVAAEDEAGMVQRVRALRERHGKAPNFRLVTGISALVGATDAQTDDMAALLQHVEEHRPSLIVVDTLAASISGLDENAAKDMDRIVKAMRGLTRFGAAVVIVHHSPKSGDTPRGYGSLNGDCDMTIIVGPEPTAEGVKRGELKKNRNGTLNLDIAFRIESATLGEDKDGDPITAPVCLERTAAEVRADSREKLTKAEDGALAALRRLAVAKLPPDAPPTARLPAVPYPEWETACAEFGVCAESKTESDRRKQFRKGRDGLEAKVRIRWEREGNTVQYLGKGFVDVASRPVAPAWTRGIVLPPPAPEPTDAREGARPDAMPHLASMPRRAMPALSDLATG